VKRDAGERLETRLDAVAAARGIDAGRVRAPADRTPESLRIAITNLHRSPPMNQSETDLGIVNESQLLRLDISSCRTVGTIFAWK
jgi:hypothetical protein